MKFLRYLSAFLLLSFSALAQTGVAFQSNAVTTVSINGTFVLRPVPSANVFVCGYAETSCNSANKVTVYSDIGLSQPVSQPVVADKYGNFGYYLGPGQFKYSIYSASTLLATYPFTSGSGFPGSPILSVTSFGAVGDGIHDDTAAINAGISSLSTSGGTLYFPIGTYTTTTGIALSTASANCVNMVGAGPSVTTIKATATMPAIYYRPYGVEQRGCTVSGIAFNGNGLAKSPFVKAGQPTMLIENVKVYGGISDSNVGISDAPMILGQNISNGPHGEVSNGHAGDGLGGGDYETKLSHVLIVQNLPSAGLRDLRLNQTVSDSTFDDVVTQGNGSISSIYQWSGGGNVWTHAHCYPTVQAAHQPTCIWDSSGKSAFVGTEADGMLLAAIVFDSVQSMAVGTQFVYLDNTVNYSAAYGFQQTAAALSAGGRNQSFGASCDPTDTSVVGTWTLIGTDTPSLAISASGPSACAFGAPVTAYNLTSEGITVRADGTAKQLLIEGLADPTQQLVMGYNTSTNRSIIQSIKQGTSNEPLDLNPNGGDVTVGGTQSIVSYITSGAGTCTPTGQIITLKTASGTAFNVQACN